MTNINKYQAYKDSGVTWLGDIPVHWEVESFKNILTERNEKNQPIRTKEILSLSIDKGVTLYAEKTTNLDRFKDDFSQYKLAYKGDLVLNSMNMIVGAVGVSEYFGCVSPVYYTYHGGLDNSNTSKFYEYLFRCKTVQGVLYSLGKGLIAIDRGEGKYNTLRLKVSRDDLRSLRLPFPNHSEQTAIVTYLDSKTALIDQAIGIKQKQIELLKERRQILIHKAVTRGINPNVKLKDSGVEWIGEIPEGWEVARVKQYSSKISKGTTPSTEGRSILDEGPIRYIKAENIQDGFITNSPAHFIDEKTNAMIQRSQLQENDILFVIAGATLGKIAIVSKEQTPSNTNQAVAFVRPNSKVIPQYLSAWLSSSIIKELTWLVAVQSAQPNLSMENLGNFPIVLPSLKEQQNILFHIDKGSTKIATAISLKEQEIEKLKEYKATLINSAVTGKIKVS
jgi:type I restriction enzyme S subunit